MTLTKQHPSVFYGIDELTHLLIQTTHTLTQHPQTHINPSLLEHSEPIVYLCSDTKSAILPHA